MFMFDKHQQKTVISRPNKICKLRIRSFKAHLENIQKAIVIAMSNITQVDAVAINARIFDQWRMKKERREKKDILLHYS